jgi:6-phosphofructokinase 1
VKRIAVLTSGGDAPGMNAAIRSVVRTALDQGVETFGVRSGYRGLLEGDYALLGSRDVSNVLQRGGTFLGSARCPEFAEAERRAEALDGLRKNGIEGLVVIGGNGSQAGSHAISQTGFPVVGVASTIDNDLYGSDITIGVDTALNVALRAVDQLKVTASSHRRASILEVMGRHCGYLALVVGIAGGAEIIVIPEIEMSLDEVAEQMRQAYDRGKSHALVVVAEGATHDARALSEHLGKIEVGFDFRVTVLGHVQRGGTPTVADRLLGTRLGAAAAEKLLEGEHGVLVGKLDGKVGSTPLHEVVATPKPLDRTLFPLTRVLAQ